MVVMVEEGCMVTEDRLVHPKKAYLPIFVSVSGRLMDLSCLQSRNASSPIWKMWDVGDVGDDKDDIDEEDRAGTGGVDAKPDAEVEDGDEESMRTVESDVHL
mmetsp:Transcript_20928/g.31437  ORF Transcript_20928/g.31437 Transcript_20928/m.31437 type:complete len:102 (+) Transcript_20928:841-1146(+)